MPVWKSTYNQTKTAGKDCADQLKDLMIYHDFLEDNPDVMRMFYKWKSESIPFPQRGGVNLGNLIGMNIMVKNRTYDRASALQKACEAHRAMANSIRLFINADKTGLLTRFNTWSKTAQPTGRTRPMGAMPGQFPNQFPQGQMEGPMSYPSMGPVMGTPTGGPMSPSMGPMGGPMSPPSMGPVMGNPMASQQMMGGWSHKNENSRYHRDFFDEYAKPINRHKKHSLHKKKKNNSTKPSGRRSVHRRSTNRYNHVKNKKSVKGFLF